MPSWDQPKETSSTDRNARREAGRSAREARGVSEGAASICLRCAHVATFLIGAETKPEIHAGREWTADFRWFPAVEGVAGGHAFGSSRDIEKAEKVLNYSRARRVVGSDRRAAQQHASVLQGGGPMDVSHCGTLRARRQPVHSSQARACERSRLRSHAADEYGSGPREP
jgi:hypothetical protein